MEIENVTDSESNIVEVNPILDVIVQRAVKILAEEGSLEKKDVLDHLNLGEIAEAIDWERVFDQLTEREGVDLVPLAQRYFRRSEGESGAPDPQRFMASGHGARTGGYANVRLVHGRLTITTVSEAAVEDIVEDEKVSALAEVLSSYGD